MRAREERMRIGFVGLGRMGLPMSRHIARAGYPLVVHNRTRAKEAAVTDLGAEPAASPGDVARASDVVLACLPTLAATEEVFLDADGVVANAREGMVLVDHSTIGPGLAGQVAKAAAGKGAAFLDAPISGGPAGAEAATLAIMVGGDPDAFQRVRPVLEVMGGNVRRMGDVGAGCVTKLVNQLLTFVHATAAAEAMALAATAGANPLDLLSILRTAWGQSTMLERGAQKYAERDFEAGAPLRLFEKDMGLIEDMARAGNIKLPLAAAAAKRLRRAVEMGLENEDLVAVLRPYEQESGIIVGGNDHSGGSAST